MELTLQKDGVVARADTHGAELFSYCLPNGRQVLWGGSEKSWPGRSPVLFPIVGPVPGNRIEIDGELRQMRRHGFARDMEYQVAEQTQESVTFTACANEETLERYPYRFRISVTHRLEKAGFTTSYTVKNEDERPLGYCIGGHVGFVCPMAADDRFEDYQLSWPDAECVLLFPYDVGPTPRATAPELVAESCTGLPVSHKLFDQGPLFLAEVPNKIITLQNPRTGIGVRMEYEGFPVMALWSKEYANAPFLCIEPWHGVPQLEIGRQRFEDKRFMIHLNPGEEKTLSYRVTVLEPAAHSRLEDAEWDSSF